MNLIQQQRYDPFDDNVKNFQGYNGNLLIKKAGVQIEWTPAMVQEYFKCKEDPIYFAEKYMKIIVKGQGLVQIKLFDYQKVVLDDMQNKQHYILMMPRQQSKCCCKDTLLNIKDAGIEKEMTIEELFLEAKGNYNE